MGAELPVTGGSQVDAGKLLGRLLRGSPKIERGRGVVGEALDEMVFEDGSLQRHL